MFDGKIGIWPFTTTNMAVRTSKNRAKGTLETKNVPTVDRKAYKAYLLEHVIPAIKCSWPRGEKSQTIWIQQDNAKPHVPVDDPDVVAAGQSDGWDIRIVCQPAQSPDFNVLDLGFFASIQALQYQEETHTIDKLIDAVNTSFKKLSWQTLDNTFLTLQKVYECSMNIGGGNEYRLPHMGKMKLRKANRLPQSFTCTVEVFQRSMETLEMAKEDKYWNK